MKFSIRLLYLYLFSFIGLIIAVIGAIRLIQLGIKVYVFNNADIYSQYNAPLPQTYPGPDGKQLLYTKEEIDTQKKANDLEAKRQRQREIAEAVAMLIAGIPLYLYHWKTIQKESSQK